jgi:hypothetical protein
MRKRAILLGYRINLEAVMQEAFSGWMRQSYFSLQMLDSLHDLNHRFLDLVGASADDWRLSRKLELPGDASGLVAPLSTAQRAAAANCPYALFDLRFHDDEYWRVRLTKAGHWRVADEMVGENETANFVKLALFYAWHVASTARLGAQLLLGMNEHTAAAFRNATLNSLPALAASEAVHLCARWRNSDTYWSALVRAALRADAARLRRVQLFGVQLAAAGRLI